MKMATTQPASLMICQIVILQSASLFVSQNATLCTGIEKVLFRKLLSWTQTEAVRLMQGFSKGALGPPWGHGAVLWGPRVEAFTTGSFGVILHNPNVTIY